MAAASASGDHTGMRTSSCDYWRRSRRPAAGSAAAQLGIDAVILESRTRQYIENRVRAGVLEHQTTRIIEAVGAAEPPRREALRHQGVELVFRWPGPPHRFRCAHRQVDDDLWSTGGREGPHRRAPGPGPAAALQGRERVTGGSGFGYATGVVYPMQAFHSGWTATSSPDATASMASAVPASPQGSSRFSSASYPYHGLGFSRTHRPWGRSSMGAMRTDLHCIACARRASRVCTCSAGGWAIGAVERCTNLGGNCSGG